jgi:hypothetical protein
MATKQFFLVGDPNSNDDPPMWLVAVQGNNPGAAIPIPKAVVVPILGMFRRAIDGKNIAANEASAVVAEGEQLVQLTLSKVHLNRIGPIALSTDRTAGPIMTRRSVGLLQADQTLGAQTALVDSLLQVGFLQFE